VRAALGIALLLFACRDPAPPAPAKPKQTIYRSHTTMGSQVTITAYTDDERGAVAAFEAAFREFDRLDALLTVWRPDSDVSRINAAAGSSAVTVAPETMEAIVAALALSKSCDGKFDITFGALSGLWRFDHDQDDRIPSDEEIASRLPLIGWEMVEIDQAKRTVKLAKAGMKMHLGGIGKGFAVDRAVALLEQRGFTDFMVQAGGDLYVSGRKGDRNWRVGIRDPRGPPSSFFAAAEVTDATFSTSGDYERFFIQDGRRYHHIIDPDVGRPAMASRSVTIMAPDATTAEGLSKCVFILGPEKGLALVESLPGAGAVIVDPDNRVHVSKRLEGKVRLDHPPTP
jgi:thiamine biosynthesis lipoprotein